MTETFTDLDEFAARLRETHPEMLDGDRSAPRGARARWQPVLARVYGIRPWEMGRLTFRELQAIADDAEAVSRG